MGRLVTYQQAGEFLRCSLHVRWVFTEISQTFLNWAAIISNVISVIVAYIPEGLPISVTLTLTVVAKRMSKANVLVKSLPTVETLGAVDVIASDKTGTLTQNKMQVVRLYLGA